MLCVYPSPLIVPPPLICLPRKAQQKVLVQISVTRKRQSVGYSESCRSIIAPFESRPRAAIFCPLVVVRKAGFQYVLIMVKAGFPQCCRAPLQSLIMTRIRWIFAGTDNGVVAHAFHQEVSVGIEVVDNRVRDV